MITAQTLTNSEGAVKYYTEYCIAGGEKEGRWYGGAATYLTDPNLLSPNLSGQVVNPKSMERLGTGFSPDGTPLVQRAGPEHAMGVDFCFSAPKSVSIVWSTASERTREIVENAHNEAAKFALDYLEDEACFGRTGKGGTDRIKAQNLFAMFQHSSSRAGDPQLHTHAIMFNVARCEDGKFRTLQYKHYFKRKMAAGALYKVSLAHSLQKAGFKVKRTVHSFEIVGVPNNLIDFRSTRSNEIEELAEQSGLDRASASVFAKQAFNFITRNKHNKDSIPQFEQWAKEHQEMGFSNMTVENLKRHEFSYKAPSNRLRRYLVSQTNETLISQRSTFPTYVYLRRLAEHSIGRMSPKDVYTTFRKAKASYLMPLKSLFDSTLYTTNHKYLEEQETVSLYSRRIGEARHQIKADLINKIIADEESRLSKKAGKPVSLSPDQLATVVGTAVSENGISLISGVAGSGKTFAMHFLNKIYERTGYTMVALAPTNIAAENIKKDVGIDGMTLHSFLYRSVNIGRKHVIIIDEAAMVGSNFYNRILRRAEIFGAKVILVGDTKQVQPVEAGQMFGTFKDKFGAEELTSVRRQVVPGERDAILHIRNGLVDKTFDYFDKNGLLHLEETQKSAEKIILKKWHDYTVSNPSNSSLIVATTNYVVNRLNQAIRTMLKAEGKLDDGYRFIKGKGEIEVSKGDRLIFTESDKRQGIYNSQIVQVVKVNSISITVKKSDGSTLSFNPAAFSDFQHGYAVTPNKSQGMTVDKAFVVVDGNLMDREKFYEALSRGRRDNEIFINSVNFPPLSVTQVESLKIGTESDRSTLRRKFVLRNVIEEVNQSHIKDTSQDYDRKNPFRTIELLQYSLKQNLKRLTEEKGIYLKK